MRLSIKAKQIAGVTSLVGLTVVALSVIYLSSLVRIRLEESQSRGELLANAVFHRARELVGGPDPYAALAADAGLRAILESSAYSDNVTYAAIVDPNGVAVAHSDAQQVGKPLPDYEQLSDVLRQGFLAQLGVVYSDQGRTLEVREPLLLGSQAFGSIRIGVSTLLIRRDVNQALRPALITLAVALVASILVAILLAQLLLRPIHLIRESLSRFGERDLGLAGALPRDEFGELGDSLTEASARLMAKAPSTAEKPAALEPVTTWLEDGIAVFDADGVLRHASSGIRRMLPRDAVGRTIVDLLPEGHPYRAAVEGRLDGVPPPRGAVLVRVPRPGQEPGASVEQAIRCQAVAGADPGRPLAVVLVARDIERLRQVRSDLSSSRRVATFGRLSAGLAHEMKNRLNATSIQLELFRQELAEDGKVSVALRERAAVVAAQILRLDEIVQGFLRFIRPEQLRLQPTKVSAVIEGILPVVEAEAATRDVTVRVDCPADLPEISADAPLLEQAFLNLAINACQAMPGGGMLKISAAPAWGHYVEIVFEDTGVGIASQELGRIFDMYYTTKEGGSGIGLSMVFRAIHLHDGEIEVQSTPGRGTMFRVLVPQV
jgi:signal transduction histidine kinase